MRVIADRKRCVGNGICEGIEPNVFEVGEDGIVIVHDAKMSDADHEQVAHAVHNCPAKALNLAETMNIGVR